MKIGLVGVIISIKLVVVGVGIYMKIGLVGVIISIKIVVVGVGIYMKIFGLYSVFT